MNLTLVYCYMLLLVLTHRVLKYTTDIVRWRVMVGKVLCCNIPSFLARNNTNQQLIWYPTIVVHCLIGSPFQPILNSKYFVRNHVNIVVVLICRRVSLCLDGHVVTYVCTLLLVVQMSFTVHGWWWRCSISWCVCVCVCMSLLVVTRWRNKVVKWLKIVY